MWLVGDLWPRSLFPDVPLYRSFLTKGWLVGPGRMTSYLSKFSDDGFYYKHRFFIQAELRDLTQEVQIFIQFGISTFGVLSGVPFRPNLDRGPSPTMM